MVDITHKNNTLREASAQAIVNVGNIETIHAIHQNKVPKGHVFEMSKAAGLLAVKKTPEILPDCHPIPIEFTSIEYEVKGLDIYIKCTIKTIYKTGVEVEAMHGASVVALNLYDMLKPLDKDIKISEIKLLSKSGGKSDIRFNSADIQAAVIVCSDSISKGIGEDKAGKTVCEILNNKGVEIYNYQIIPDDLEGIRSLATEFINQKISLIIFCGGTGVSPRDNTADALKTLLTKPLPGVEEAMRSYGQNRSGLAMFSRSVAGIAENSLLLGIPGSTKGSVESINAVFPTILHLFEVLKGSKHS